MFNVIITREMQSNHSEIPLHTPKGDYYYYYLKQVLESMWRNWNSYALLMGMWNGIATNRDSTEVPQRIKERITT